MYLASPYTTPDEALKARRVFLTMKAMASLHAQNIVAYSPIVQWYEIAKQFGLADDHVPWLVQNEGMMIRCQHVGILRLDGWRESRGCRHELQFAWRHRFPITAFDLVGDLCINQGPLDVTEFSELA